MGVLTSTDSMVLSQAYNEIMRRMDICALTGEAYENGQVVGKPQERQRFISATLETFATLKEIRRQACDVDQP